MRGRWAALAWLAVMAAFAALWLWLQDGWQCETWGGTWEEGSWCR